MTRFAVCFLADFKFVGLCYSQFNELGVTNTYLMGRGHLPSQQILPHTARHPRTQLETLSRILHITAATPNGP